MQIQPIQMPISMTQGAINPIAPITIDTAQNAAEVAPSNFKDLMKKALTDLNASQVSSTDAIKSLATGEKKISMMLSLKRKRPV